VVAVLVNQAAQVAAERVEAKAQQQLLEAQAPQVKVTLVVMDQ
tara:strand:- start:167 stop:295 length:129 start_codon:yes stop_codon:yes gene_type:complete